MTGNFTIESGTVKLTAAGAGGTGTTTLAGGNLTVNGTYTLNAGSFNGIGTLTGNLNNVSGGTHAGSLGSPGTLTITGTYTQGGQGKLSADIDASGNISQIPSFSSMTLAGTVTVTRNVNYKPSSGTLTFLQATSFVNDFTTKTINNNSWVAADGNPYHFVFQKNAQTYTLVVTAGASVVRRHAPSPVDSFFLLAKPNGNSDGALSALPGASSSGVRYANGVAVDRVFAQSRIVGSDAALVGSAGSTLLETRALDGFEPADSFWQVRELPNSLE